MSTPYVPNAVITSRRDFTPELALFQVRSTTGPIPTFEPGQYAELGIEHQGKLERRAYSISSSPLLTETLEFYIVLVPNGIVTPKLFEMNVGSELWLGPKVKGKFTLNAVAPDKELVAIATGTGIAPFISMLRTFRKNPPWRKFVIVHGVRYVADLGYREELENYVHEDSRIAYVPTVTRETPPTSTTGIPITPGRVHAVLDQHIFQTKTGVTLNPETSQILLCGNPEMITSVQTSLEERGFREHSKKNPGQIHVERYW